MVSAADIELQDPIRVTLSAIDQNSVAARTFGFRATDGNYFYSYYGGPSSYNIGTCVAGSVRVRFES